MYSTTLYSSLYTKLFIFAIFFPKSSLLFPISFSCFMFIIPSVPPLKILIIYIFKVLALLIDFFSKLICFFCVWILSFIERPSLLVC